MRKNQSNKIIFSFLIFLLNDILIQILSSFLEDFDQYSLSQICSMMNQNLRRKIEKEEQNVPWDSYIKLTNYG